MKKTFGTGIDHPHSKRAEFTLKDAAIAFVGSRLSLDASALTFKSGFSGEAAQHAYIKQTHVWPGLSIVNYC